MSRGLRAFVMLAGIAFILISMWLIAYAKWPVGRTIEQYPVSQAVVTPAR